MRIVPAAISANPAATSISATVPRQPSRERTVAPTSIGGGVGSAGSAVAVSPARDAMR
jgi:hypothetical protein